MSTTKHAARVALWHYQCPECGITDAELGYQASADTIHCEICLEEQRFVRLKRWPVEDSGSAPDSPSGRGS